MREAAFPAPKTKLVAERLRLLEGTVTEEFEDPRACGAGRLEVVLLPVDEGVWSHAKLRGGFADFEATVHADGADVISQGVDRERVIVGFGTWDTERNIVTNS